MSLLKLAVISVKSGATLESQSGLQMLNPKIYGAYMEPTGPKKVAAIIMHPTSNFMGHYLIEPLAKLGVCCMGLNSRYAGNDTLLLMERVIQDLGAGVKFLRELGYEKVVLIGNSGGAALASFYQSQAENLTAHNFAHGAPTHLHQDDLPQVDGIALAAAHQGRSRLLNDWIDPAVTDELDPLSLNASLDMYTPENINGEGHYSADFLQLFKQGQQVRITKIENWVLARLALLKNTEGAAHDQVFQVFRTHADPRCVDLSLDSNDRKPGSVWGDARQVNYSANAMGRSTSLGAFLSQWSSKSQADGPTNLAKTTIPKILLTYTADQSTFPSTRDAWLKAGGDNITNVNITGGNHYLAGQPRLILQAAESIADFIHNL